MMKSLVIAATLLAVAAPVSAQTALTDPAADQSATTPKAKDPNRMICEKVEEIGTRLGGRKVCRTAAEWDAARRAAKGQVDDWQRQLTSPGKPAG